MKKLFCTPVLAVRFYLFLSLFNLFCFYGFGRGNIWYDSLFWAAGYWIPQSAFLLLSFYRRNALIASVALAHSLVFVAYPLFYTAASIFKLSALIPGNLLLYYLIWPVFCFVSYFIARVYYRELKRNSY